MSEHHENEKPSQPLVPTTHFGYQEVPETEKEQLVKGVFSSVASKYDLMNDLMSLGVHRLWKRFTVDLARPRPGQRVLDLAGGTGDRTDDGRDRRAGHDPRQRVRTHGAPRTG